MNIGASEATYLTRHLDWIAVQRWVEEFYTETSELRRDLVAGDRPPLCIPCHNKQPT